MIYTPENAPPGLRVLLDGKFVKHVFSADSNKGIIKSYRHPFKVDKHGKRCLSKTQRGIVEFEQ
jgi:hypothetical protein